MVSPRTPSSASSRSEARDSLPAITAVVSTSTGTSSPANQPSAWARAARRWLSAAKASWSARETPYFFATSSAVMPIPA